MRRKPNRPPEILLVGMGRFGREHFLTWKKLEAEGIAHLAGVVVRSAAHRDQLLAELGVPVFAGLHPSVLENVDKVDIVTPAVSHASLVMQCLPHADVLVEKPLAHTLEDAHRVALFARRQPKLLMVNHLYRFHPAILHIRKLMSRERSHPRMVSVSMINPLQAGTEAMDAHLELLHPFDILDMLLGNRGKASFAQATGFLHLADLHYPDGILARTRFGWSGEHRVRSVEVEYSQKRFSADLSDASVLIQTRQSLDRLVLADVCRPLEQSLRAFAARPATRESARSNPRPDAADGERVLRLSLSAKTTARRARPRVAVIGGGIFGVSCAIELAPHSDVVIFERHSELLMEATFSNQWRHHSGFHYPRSLETVREIQRTRDDFRDVYGEGVIRKILSYYCTSASAREITRERYLESCSAGGLEFTITDPPDGILDRSQVDLCIRTDEGVFHFYALRERIERLLSAMPTVELRTRTEVTGARWGKSGSKILSTQKGAHRKREEFDFVVNASYANLNLLANWLGFPIQPLRFDLCEMLVVDLPMDPVCITILDGPFTSLVGTGRPGEFLLSHIHESILRSAVTADGLPPLWDPWVSNRSSLLRQCSRYLPILGSARIRESRYATRAVRAFSEDYDGRPTVVTEHGFGCWSVLGGKIVTSVSSARSIVQQILRQAGD